MNKLTEAIAKLPQNVQDALNIRRADMRREYVRSMSEVVGADFWGTEDDQAFDAIDALLMRLIDRAASGKISLSKPIDESKSKP
jgi:hypothetical protein